MFNRSKELVKSRVADRLEEKHLIGRQTYINKLNQLFDIAKCQCKELNNCCCLPEFRVPVMELVFGGSKNCMSNGNWIP